MPLPFLAPDRFPLYLAPMAGYTDLPFRQFCKRHGADVLVSEFVPAEALRREAPAVWASLAFTEDQRPFGIQLFGGDPPALAEAARLVVERLGPDFLDLNFGCPAPRVTCAQAGSALLRDLDRMERVGEAVVRAVPATPVTAKLRLGWDETTLVAPEAARRLAGVGIQALAIHGRTRQQEYRGEADWAAIQQVVEAVPIPVIGNGGIRSPEDALRRRATTGVRGLMIGRAALAYPWIFREIKEAWRTGQIPPPLTPAQRWQALLEYARLLLDDAGASGQPPNLARLRPRLKALTHGLPDSRRLRAALEKALTWSDLEELAERWGGLDGPREQVLDRGLGVG